MNNDKTISALNDLIVTCRDGQEGFKEAAENTKSLDLKSFFEQASLARAQMAGELQQEVRALGGDPEKAGSTAGAIHRAWLDVKGSLVGRDDHAILTECESGEDSAVRAYENVLKQPLPTPLQTMIQRQYDSVRQVHDRIKRMRDAQGAAGGRR